MENQYSLTFEDNQVPLYKTKDKVTVKFVDIDPVERKVYWNGSKYVPHTKFSELIGLVSYDQVTLGVLLLQGNQYYPLKLTVSLTQFKQCFAPVLLTNFKRLESLWFDIERVSTQVNTLHYQVSPSSNNTIVPDLEIQKSLLRNLLAFV